MMRACTLRELREQNQVVVRGADRPIVVFYNGGDVRAVDNRCPHMGFPFSKGTCQDGLITCHWHHARFDAHSGCAFDLWADDVEPFDVEIPAKKLRLRIPSPRDAILHARHRLQEGLAQNIPLIAAKSILMLRGSGVANVEIVRDVALFGCRSRDGWSMGMTILAAMTNLLPLLTDETAFLALYQGARRVAADCEDQPPRIDRQPLETSEIEPGQLERWLRHWTLARHRDGAERTLLTAVHNGATDRRLAELILIAATERFYADSGHTVDFCNKAFELLDVIGWERAREVLPTLTAQIASARGAEETSAWRHPIDLVDLVKSVTSRLPKLFEAGRGQSWNEEARLADAILGEDPVEILESIARAIRRGAQPVQLSKALAFAAVMRIARFSKANEIGDWIGALHTFSYCNAVHQSLKRCPEPHLTRAVLHGAMSVYLHRFLNVPPAKLPGEGAPLEEVIGARQEFLDAFLSTLDTQRQVDRASRLVVSYLAAGQPMEPLFDTLACAALREDANFHTLQMLEAGVRQAQEWGPDTEQSRNVLIAVARYLAAHSPTMRSQLQTARIALRLSRGDEIYEPGD